MREWHIASEGDTERFAHDLAHVLRGGHAVGLSGGLGAGKTTLVRYLVEGLGGEASHVASPTYTLEHEYRTSSRVLVDHWDLYRITALPEELYAPVGVDTIRVIEWPERCPELSDELDLHVYLEAIDETSRRVSFEGALAEELYTRLNAELA